jgi:hypothetical protein
MSESLEHRELDPEVCPRCGCEFTDSVGPDHDSEEDDWLPAEIRQCPECVKREKDHGGEYRVYYRKVLISVDWADDDGVDHTMNDTESLVLDAAQELRDVLQEITCCARIQGPAGTTAYIISEERMARARAIVAKAKGEVTP